MIYILRDNYGLLNRAYLEKEKNMYWGNREQTWDTESPGEAARESSLHSRKWGVEGERNTERDTWWGLLAAPGSKELTEVERQEDSPFPQSTMEGAAVDEQLS